MSRPKAKKQQSDKILIALSFWQGDKDQASKLMRLLADLTPSHSEQADFLITARFDCKHDKAAIEYLSRRFNVHTYTSRIRATGWPGGCSAIFFSAFEWIFHKMRAGQIPHYKAVLNLGADCAPLTVHWLQEFHDAWDSLNRQRKVYVAGALIPGEYEHLNGDACLLSGDFNFLSWLVTRASQANARAGWDWAHAGDFKRWGWADIPWIKSLWNTPNFSEENWNAWSAAGVKFIHGVKNDSLLDLARKKL